MNKFIGILVFSFLSVTSPALADNNDNDQDHTCQGGHNCTTTNNYYNDTENNTTNKGIGIGIGGQGGQGGSATATGGTSSATGGSANQGQMQGQFGFGSGNSTSVGVTTNVDASNDSDYPVSSAIAPALGSAPQGFCVRTEGASLGVSTFGFGVSGGAYHQVDDEFCQKITIIQNLGLLPANFEIKGFRADQIMGAMFISFPEVEEAIQVLEGGTTSYAVPKNVEREDSILSETDQGADNKKWEPVQVNNR